MTTSSTSPSRLSAGAWSATSCRSATASTKRRHEPMNVFPYVADPFSGADDTHGDAALEDGRGGSWSQRRRRSLTAAVLLFGGVCPRTERAAATRPTACPAAEQLQRGFAAGDTQALVAGCKPGCARARRTCVGSTARPRLPAARPRDRRSRRTTPSRAACCARRSRLAPRDLIATSGLASLALSRHRFAARSRLGRRALSISPTTARNYGVIGDAQLELGRYRAGVRGLRHGWRALKPGVSSYARIAYARELLGYARRARAARCCSRRDAAADEREPLAWTETQLGKLELSTRPTRTPPRRHMRVGARTFPGYVVRTRRPAPRSRSPAVTFAGRPRSSGVPSSTIPLPQFVGLYGDLLQRRRATNVPRACSTRPSDGIRAAAGRERRAHRPRDRALRRRPRDPAPRRARARAQGAARAAVDRRRRRARLGARAQRHVRRGTALLAACSSARHEGRAEALPPRRDRARASATTRARGLERALGLNPHFSLLWAPTLRRLAHEDA